MDDAHTLARQMRSMIVSISLTVSGEPLCRTFFDEEVTPRYQTPPRNRRGGCGRCRTQLLATAQSDRPHREAKPPFLGKKLDG
jgi:hypothetical protein